MKKRQSRGEQSRGTGEVLSALQSFLFSFRNNIISSPFTPGYPRPFYNETMNRSLPWPWGNDVFLSAVSIKTPWVFRLRLFCKVKVLILSGKGKRPQGEARKHQPFMGPVTGRALWHDTHQGRRELEPRPGSAADEPEHHRRVVHLSWPQRSHLRGKDTELMAWDPFSSEILQLRQGSFSLFLWNNNGSGVGNDLTALRHEWKCAFLRGLLREAQFPRKEKQTTPKCKRGDGAKNEE